MAPGVPVVSHFPKKKLPVALFFGDLAGGGTPVAGAIRLSALQEERHRLRRGTTLGRGRPGPSCELQA